MLSTDQLRRIRAVLFDLDGTLLHTSPLALASQVGGLAGHALLAWLLK